MLRAVLLLILAPGLCAAGPWLREEGSTYLSFSAELSGRLGTDAWISVYAEHGLSERLTVGLDAGGRHDGRAARALVFARLPIVAEGDWRVASQIGIGATLDDDETVATVRPGLSVGRGLDVMAGGWAAADLFADLTADGETRVGLDAVLGLRPAEGRAWLLGLRASEDGVRLVPGYERAFGPAAVALSAVVDPEGDAPAALALRTVFEF